MQKTAPVLSKFVCLSTYKLTFRCISFGYWYIKYTLIYIYYVKHKYQKFCYVNIIVCPCVWYLLTLQIWLSDTKCGSTLFVRRHCNLRSALLSWFCRCVLLVMMWPGEGEDNEDAGLRALLLGSGASRLNWHLPIISHEYCHLLLAYCSHIN